MRSPHQMHMHTCTHTTNHTCTQVYVCIVYTCVQACRRVACVCAQACRRVVCVLCVCVSCACVSCRHVPLMSALGTPMSFLAVAPQRQGLPVQQHVLRPVGAVHRAAPVHPHRDGHLLRVNLLVEAPPRPPVLPVGEGDHRQRGRHTQAPSCFGCAGNCAHVGRGWDICPPPWGMIRVFGGLPVMRQFPRGMCVSTYAYFYVFFSAISIF